MPVSVSRLRHWFAVAAIVLIVVVAGFYLYARLRVNRVMKQVPKSLGVEVQQSTEGFSLSKSEQGHTIFTIRADRAVQYKEGGRAELKNVNIVVYGRGSNRFDQIYGSDFAYDPQTGDITSRGEVHIDLEGDTQGSARPDQAPPQELKNPIHVKTSGLVFNQKTGMARTAERVEFRIPQAVGWANGAAYDSKANQLALQSDVHVNTSGAAPVNLTAQRATISKEPHTAVLYAARLERGASTVEARELTAFLRPDNSVDRMVASGDVRTTTRGATTMTTQSPQAEMWLTGRSNELKTARLSGGVQMEASGASVMRASASQVTMNFAGKNQLSMVRAQGGVHLLQPPQRPAPSAPKAPNTVGTAPAQTVELAADIVDFFMTGGGKVLKRAETSGAAQITITPEPAQTAANPAVASPMAGAKKSVPPPARTVITAGRFVAAFGKDHRLSTIDGTPKARVVSSTPGQPDRITTSQYLQAVFAPAGGISKVTQKTRFEYHEAEPARGTERAAWAEMAVYTPLTGELTLTGAPRVVDGTMTTTARLIRLNRLSGDAAAEGEVKSTYSEMKPQPSGAMLAGSDPIHVTARNMTAQRATGTARYSGDARLWQSANVVQAPTIDFDRNERSVIALGSSGQRVATVLVQQDKSGKLTPVNITSARLTYVDAQRKARFDGGVVIKGQDSTVTAEQVEVFLQPAGQTATARLPGASQVEHIVAEKNVVAVEPKRRATGQKLVYTAAEEKFVLTGGPPSIFDAERGQITGSSLTFWNRDDRVLVESGPSSRSVTHTRVSK